MTLHPVTPLEQPVLTETLINGVIKTRHYNYKAIAKACKSNSGFCFNAVVSNN